MASLLLLGVWKKYYCHSYPGGLIGARVGYACPKVRFLRERERERGKHGKMEYAVVFSFLDSEMEG